ncbi:tetratricopeptide repeat protein, partial [Arthrospira platensis SPKY1]|nr:tetratricopeptide repeat protein [Arthrospira platensis SPKY1]
ERKDYDKTEEYYKTALENNPDYDTKIYFSLALVQELNGKVEEALGNYRYFISNCESQDDIFLRAVYKEQLLNFRLTAINDPVPFNPERLSENINSDWSEYLP